MTRMLICGHAMVWMQCGTCGVWHAFPESIYDNAKYEGGYWSCPNGHKRGWAEGEKQEEINKLRRRAERAEQQQAKIADERDAALRQASAARGQVTRIKNRVGRGVCPCCKRTFANVARHMASQHPEYHKEAG